MDHGSNFFLVDGDFRRRAAISHYLASKNIRIEVFETPAELMRHWPRGGLLLAHDDGNAIGELIAHMGASGVWMPVIAYAADPTTHQVVQAVLDGAIDFIAWPFTPEQIIAVIDEGMRKAETLGHAKLREAMARSRVERLTKRERQVLAHVMHGLSNRVIGERLAISPRTVEIHRANMLNKLGVDHTSKAIRIAIEASMDDPR